MLWKSIGNYFNQLGACSVTGCSRPCNVCVCVCVCVCATAMAESREYLPPLRVNAMYMCACTYFTYEHHSF